MATNPYKAATGIQSDGELDEPPLDPDHEKGPEESLDKYKAWLVKEQSANELLVANIRKSQQINKEAQSKIRAVSSSKLSESMIKNMYQPSKEEEIEEIEDDDTRKFEGMNDPYKTLVDLKTDDLVKE